MRIEAPTFALIVLCHVTWAVALFWAPMVHTALAILLAIPAIALHASLQHEVIHGHPRGTRRLGVPLVFASLNLAIPYLRFRDTHLDHHHDETLTDPYEDPETAYLDPAIWARLPRAARAVLTLNNTLAGRMLLGPLVAQIAFMAADLRLIRAGVPGVARAWGLHLMCSAAILAFVALSPMPVWAYLIACYAALSVLKIRTFLEHQAHARAEGRTVIIEDRGPLAFLFLNNNLHVVHHMHPGQPWYRLPRLYAADRARYLTRNGGYRYASYGAIFRAYFLRAKEPVAHPLYKPGPSSRI